MSFVLIEVASGKPVQSFGSLPEPLVWPNGDASHAVSVGIERGGLRLVEVKEGPEQPNEFYEISATKPELTKTELVVTRTWSPVDLSRVQDELNSRIDAQAEQRRALYITPGSGQALTYQEKIYEARAYVSSQSPKDSDFPMLAATVGVDGDSVAAVAKTIIEVYGQWLVIGSEIERLRRQAKSNIAQAKSVDDAIAAFSAVKWS